MSASGQFLSDVLTPSMTTDARIGVCIGVVAFMALTTLGMLAIWLLS